MRDAELVREIAQPLTDQSWDYDALNQTGARTRTHSQSPPSDGLVRGELARNGNASAMISHEVLSECDASSHRFAWPMSKSKDRTTR